MEMKKFLTKVKSEKENSTDLKKLYIYSVHLVHKFNYYMYKFKADRKKVGKFYLI